MTRPDDEGKAGADRRLDAAIRAAADRPVDEARLARQVLARVRARPKPSWPAFPNGGALAPAAFAAYALILVATPFLVASAPLGDYDPIAGIALTAALGGDDLLPMLLSGGLGDDGAGG